MILLYADESGSVHDTGQTNFVLAGIAVYERQNYWLSEELNKIAGKFNPADPDAVELHGSPMLNGRGFWRQFSLPDRIQAIKDALTVLVNSHSSHAAFACVIKKSSIPHKDPVEVAFEQLASRFDYFLKRCHKRGNTQRGLIIFDKTTYETTIQTLATDFRKIGHTWGVLRNLSEVPLFIDSKASRLIQLADLVAYALFRYFEKNDSQFYSIIKNRFDNDGGQMHGLCEIR